MAPGNGQDPPSRILVVDDTEANRDMLSRRLQKQGHTVAMAETGPVALELMAREPFDLVLLDIMMPGMSGYEVLERLKADEALRHVPVIMITAITDTESVIRCIEMGAEDHLPKPFNATLLKARIDSSLAKKRLRDREQVLARAMARELEIGRNIQATFLPESLPAVQGFELAAFFRPARQVAGDFYDAFPLPQGGSTALIVGDVCDKGVGAALFMAVFRSLLRVLTRETFSHGSLDPSLIARILQVLSDYNVRTHSSANMFATLFFGVLEPESGRLSYVNAGHDAPLLMRKGAILDRLAPTGPAVGLMEGMEFGVREVTLAPGDDLLAYTDGVTDARDSGGVAYGEERLAALLARGNGSVGDLLALLEQDLSSYTDSSEWFDDVTLLALRRMS